MSTTPPSGRGSAGLLLLVALAGGGTMVVELAAVRLLAPWFGASAAVWTNVIGVVLLALALGYLLGARLAAGPRPERSLGVSLLASAGWVAWLPSLAGPLAGLFLPEGVPLERVAPLLVWGSLAASMLLFGPAALALGCVGPLAVELVQQRGRLHAGTAGGRVLGASTLGSLAGTFGTTHLLVPSLGLTATFGLAAAVLALLGLWVLLAERGARALAALTLVSAGALLGPGYRSPEPAEGMRLLEARQSPYQSLRVIESGEGPDRLRQLQVNEGLDSFQSVWTPERGLLPAGYYYNQFALPAAWDAVPGSTWRVLVLGLGAGTAIRVLEGSLPEGVGLEVVGVEVDPVVVELARRWMDLAPDSPTRIILAGLDARTALHALVEGGERFDQVVLDTYANQMEIPPHLATRELFELSRGALRPRGWLSINVGGFGPEDPVVRAVAGTAAAAFGQEGTLLRVPFSRNWAVHLREGAPAPVPGDELWDRARGPARVLLGALELPGASRRVLPAARMPLLTDDRSPLEALQRRSIALAARRRAQREGVGR